MCWKYALMTFEDAYPLWIFKGLDTSSVEWALGNIPLPGRTLVDIKVPALCRSCNSNWLSEEYEKKLAKWVKPSILDSTRELLFDPSQRRVVATWAIKTALMLELAMADLRGAGFAPASHFQYIRENDS